MDACFAEASVVLIAGAAAAAAGACLALPSPAALPIAVPESALAALLLRARDRGVAAGAEDAAAKVRIGGGAMASLICALAALAAARGLRLGSGSGSLSADEEEEEAAEEDAREDAREAAAGSSSDLPSSADSAADEGAVCASPPRRRARCLVGLSVPDASLFSSALSAVFAACLTGGLSAGAFFPAAGVFFAAAGVFFSVNTATAFLLDFLPASCLAAASFFCAAAVSALALGADGGVGASAAASSAGLAATTDVAFSATDLRFGRCLDCRSSPPVLHASAASSLGEEEALSAADTLRLRLLPVDASAALEPLSLPAFLPPLFLGAGAFPAVPAADLPLPLLLLLLPVGGVLDAGADAVGAEGAAAAVACSALPESRTRLARDLLLPLAGAPCSAVCPAASPPPVLAAFAANADDDAADLPLVPPEAVGAEDDKAPAGATGLAFSATDGFSSAAAFFGLAVRLRLLGGTVSARGRKSGELR